VTSTKASREHTKNSDARQRERGGKGLPNTPNEDTNTERRPECSKAEGFSKKVSILKLTHSCKDHAGTATKGPLTFRKGRGKAGVLSKFILDPEPKDRACGDTICGIGGEKIARNLPLDFFGGGGCETTLRNKTSWRKDDATRWRTSFVIQDRSRDQGPKRGKNADDRK